MDRRTDTFKASKVISVVRDPFCLMKEMADAKNLFNCEERLAIDSAMTYSEQHPDWWSRWVSD